MLEDEVFEIFFAKSAKEEEKSAVSDEMHLRMTPKFSLYYYMNLIKLIKYGMNMGNIENTTKFSRLKSISSI